MSSVRVKLIDLRVKCPILFAHLNEIWVFLDRFFIKVPKIKFHGNPSSENRADTCGRPTDIINVIDAFKVLRESTCKAIAWR